MMGKLIAYVSVVGLACAAATPLGAQAPARAQLPDGNGKEAVATYCGQCHGLNQVVATGHTPEQWRTVVNMMINDGAKLPQDQAAMVAEYLARNFPPKAAPSPVLVPGPVQVAIREWDVPTPGSRPHDPLATADGAIWYTGQMANVLGRLDPRTGTIKEFPLKTAQSGPHGLMADRDGNIWFTANFKGYIGKLDPRTGQATEYPMPDPAARDPHSLVFDQRGILWFTAQGSNLVGRLDPQSGEVKLLKLSVPRSNPYGILVNSKGVPFFDEFGGNRIGRIDPATMEIKEYTLPDPGARPRRIAITSDDVVWYTDYARGYLGRLDPQTGAVTEFASPGGPASRPYGIASVHDVLFYNESGVEPNTIVRFDPKTQKFQTWTIPSGGGVVRNMSVTPQGDIAIACSGVNKVGLVQVKP